MARVNAGSPVIKPLMPEDPQRISDYQVLGRLGEGGMGRVYLARSRGGRMIALKVIHPVLVAEPEFRERFRREVRAARMVSGAFTAPVLDADPEAPLPWLATSFVEGPSLNQEVAQNGPLPEPRVLELAGGLAEAISSIHSAGLVHRDLKPSNVLLAADGPRVIDFGIARSADATALTHVSRVPGTPGFLSPEQVVGEEPTSASDMFSLGGVLYFATCGKGPFGVGPAHALMYRVVHDEPDLSRIASPALRRLISACLAKTPEARPSCRAVLDLATGVPRHGKPVPFETAAGAVPAGTVPVDAAIVAAPTTLDDQSPGTTLPAAGDAGAPAGSSAAGSPGLTRRRVVRAASIVGPLVALGGAFGIYEATRGPNGRPVGEQLSALTPGQRTNVFAFSPVGDLLAVGYQSNPTAELWDVSDPSRPSKIASLPGPSDSIYSLAFSRTTNLLAVGSADSSVYIWQLDGTAQPAQRSTFTADSQVSWLGFTPDDTVLALALYGNGLDYYSVLNPAAPNKIDSDGQVVGLSFGPMSSPVLMATAGASGLQVWDVTDPSNPGFPVTAPGTPSTGAAPRVAFDPKGRYIAYGTNDLNGTSGAVVQVWQASDLNAQTGNTENGLRPAGSFTMPSAGSTDSVVGLACSPDGQTVAAITDTTAQLWDISALTDPKLKATLSGSDWNWGAACDRTGSILAIGGADAAHLYRIG